MLDEIFEEVARKHKIPVEQVKLVYRSYINAIRYYLSNPLISKSVVRIAQLGAFKLTHRSVRSAQPTMVDELINYKRQYERKKPKTS